MEQHTSKIRPSLEDIIEADSSARTFAKSICN